MRFSRSKALAVVVALFAASAVLISQTVYSPATIFPSAHYQTAGTAVAPSLGWTASSTTGYYYIGAGQIGVAGALIPGTDATYDLGTSMLHWRNLYLSNALAIPSIQVNSGTSGAPSYAFQTEATLGFYRFGAATIGATGTVVPAVDNSVDLGSTTNTWRNGYWKGAVRMLTDLFGWDATATNNVLLRSEFAASSGADGPGMLGVMLGDQSGYGDIAARKILAGSFNPATATTAKLKVNGVMASVRTDNGNSGTALTVDLSTGNVHKVTLTGNVTFTLTNPEDSGQYRIEIFTGTGGFTATWPASVKWVGGAAPTITIGAGKMDLISLLYDATSADYFGWYTQNYTP